VDATGGKENQAHSGNRCKNFRFHIGHSPIQIAPGVKHDSRTIHACAFSGAQLNFFEPPFGSDEKPALPANVV
jgi:hypothetical protein